MPRSSLPCPKNSAAPAKRALLQNISSVLVTRPVLAANLQLHRAGKKKLKLDPNFSVTADVALGARDDGGFALEVRLKVNLPGINKAEAEALVVEADHTCPYSYAIRGNVPVKITVE